MSDDEFFTQVRDCSLPPAQFNHLGHLRLAWICLQRYGLDDAVRVGCASIGAYAASLGAADKFHWTTTEALMRLLWAERALPAGAPLFGAAAGQRRGARRLRRARPGALAGMSAHMSIGQLARLCGIARSTVLYYEQIGLLAPSSRSAAGYRRYVAADLERLRQLCAYRATGLSLDAIGRLLANGDKHALIAQRLDQINDEMALLREQQQVLVRLLGSGPGAVAAMDKEGWTVLLRASGLDDAAMLRWHALFERQNPEAHRAFLESLGLPAAEVARIRHA